MKFSMLVEDRKKLRNDEKWETCVSELSALCCFRLKNEARIRGTPLIVFLTEMENIRTVQFNAPVRCKA